MNRQNNGGDGCLTLIVIGLIGLLAPYIIEIIAFIIFMIIASCATMR